MVFCIVVGCSSKSGKLKGKMLFRIPMVIINQGEEQEELNTRRRNEWIIFCGESQGRYKQERTRE